MQKPAGWVLWTQDEQVLLDTIRFSVSFSNLSKDALLSLHRKCRSCHPSNSWKFTCHSFYLESSESSLSIKRSSIRTSSFRSDCWTDCSTILDCSQNHAVTKQLLCTLTRFNRMAMYFRLGERSYICKHLFDQFWSFSRLNTPSSISRSSDHPPPSNLSRFHLDCCCFLCGMDSISPIIRWNLPDHIWYVIFVVNTGF